MENLRIAYMSSSNFGLIPLQAICDLQLPVVVYTKPFTSRDRYQKSTVNPIANLSKKLSIPTVTVQNMHDEEVKATWCHYKPNVTIVASFGYIIPDFYLNLDYGCWNIHASLLPRWRGAAPIERAILAGDTTTGISIMRIVRELDAGPVIAQESIDIKDLDAKIVHNRLSHLGANLMSRILPKIIKRDFVEKEQDVSLANYAHKIDKSEFRLNWQHSSQELYQKILAFPGKAWCLWQDRRLIIHQARIIKTGAIFDSHAPWAPGSIVGKPLIVACGCSYLELMKVQLAGRRLITAEEFVHGYQSKTQEVLM